ncbi:MAG: hypothetical protein RLZZ175_3413 [Bacteroidota bacterium]
MADIHNKLVCLNSNIKLIPENIFNVYKYQWSIDGVSTSTDSIFSFNVNKNTYKVKLITLSKDLCENQSEIEVNSFNKPNISVRDTSLCLGVEYYIQSKINNNTIQNGNYFWYKNNILIDTLQSIKISESGIYVIKYGKGECFGEDSAEINYTSKDVLGIQEFPICLKDKTVKLSVKNYFKYPVKWKGGNGIFSPSDTSQNVTYTFASNENQEIAQMLFIVESLKPTITCSSKMDSIWISPLSLPIANITQDTVCEGFNTNIKAISISKNLYEWTYLGQKSYDNNLTTNAINGNLINLKIQDSITGCRNELNYNIFSVNPPSIKINFAPPCKGSTSILNTTLEIKNYLKGLGNYVWYKNNEIINNENKSSLETKNDNLYKVKFNIGECVAKDSAYVEFKDAPKLNLQDKVEFCKETDLYITLEGGTGYTKYVWEFDENQTNPKIIVNEDKYYSLTVYLYFVTLKISKKLP